MPTVRQYLDFDLLIERRGNRYRARVIDSPAGHADGEFSPPFSPLELENFFLRIGQPRQVRRRARPGGPVYQGVVQEFGGTLYQAVFNDEMRARLSSSLEMARAEQKGLRLTEAPELVNLPWEYLYNPALNRFFALSVQTSLVRYMDLPERIAPLAVQPPLRMLVMISCPSDSQFLDVEDEWARLKGTLRGLEERGAIVVDRLPDGRLSTLQRQLRRNEYHIFHYVGHGGYNPGTQEGVLLLADEEGHSRLVSGADVGVMLHDATTLRLAVLNACEGARTSQADPFAGVAQSVVQAGIPAVVAMQFEITDEAAITFAQEFYGALVDGYQVDAALAEARKIILSQGNELEWGTPVLHMRAPEGVLFDLGAGTRTPGMDTRTRPAELRPASEATPAARPVVEDTATEKRLQRLYTDASSAYWLQDWERAARLLREVVDLRPDYPSAQARLGEAQKQAHMSTLYAAASSALQAEDWARALDALEELAALQANYRDVATLLPEARKRKELASLYAEAQQLREAAQWQAILSILNRIHALQPDYPDPQGLESRARQEVARTEREEHLEALYIGALRELDEGHLAEARKSLEEIRALEAGYRESEALLARVEQEIATIEARQSAEEQPQEAQRKRTAEIAATYRQAQIFLQDGKWQQAVNALGQIRKLDPNFVDSHRIEAEAHEALHLTVQSEPPVAKAPPLSAPRAVYEEKKTANAKQEPPGYKLVVAFFARWVVPIIALLAFFFFSNMYPEDGSTVVLGIGAAFIVVEVMLQRHLP